MDYLSVKEIAELWGVSIRMVNYYLNTGRIQGAIRKSGGWLIPANTPHPADLRKSGQRGQERIPPRMAKCYMPLISRPCDNGFQNLLLTMNDEEERDIARAMGVAGTDKMTTEEARTAAIDAVRQLAHDVGIPENLREIVREEDIPFLAQSAYDDACRPGNPRETSVAEIADLYRSLL